MKKKNILIVVMLILILLIIGLWISGIIPKQIARIYSENYLKNNFSRINFEYVNIEWASAYGDYIITFKDGNNELYGFHIGPKYFPINVGQGINALREVYQEKYENENTNNSDVILTIEMEKKNNNNPVTLNDEEIKKVASIISSLSFTEETCDGIDDYTIKIKNSNDEEYKTYGLETFAENYHITLVGKGEAILSSEQMETMANIINKYF